MAAKAERQSNIHALLAAIAFKKFKSEGKRQLSIGLA
jgi:hypothetical protein